MKLPHHGLFMVFKTFLTSQSERHANQWIESSIAEKKELGLPLWYWVLGCCQLDPWDG